MGRGIDTKALAKAVVKESPEAFFARYYADNQVPQLGLFSAPDEPQKFDRGGLAQLKNFGDYALDNTS